MGANCPFEQLSTRLDRYHEEGVAIFQWKTRLLNIVNPFRWLDRGRTNKAISRYPKVQGHSRAIKLWDSRSIIVEAMARPRSFAFKLEPHWMGLIEFCKQFNRDAKLDVIRKIGRLGGGEDAEIGEASVQVVSRSVMGATPK